MKSASAWGLVVGALVGVATSFGQKYADGVGNAFVNSASAWLVAPFVVGLLAGRGRSAVVAGMVACLAEVAGYYVTAELRGFPAGTHEVVLWSLCAIPGGAVLGGAGGLQRPEVLAASFLAEGAWTYAYRLHRPATAAVWFAIGFALLLLGTRTIRTRRRPWTRGGMVRS